MKPLHGQFGIVFRRYSRYMVWIALLAILSTGDLCRAQEWPWAWAASQNGTPQPDQQPPAVRRTRLATGTAIKMKLQTAILGKQRKPQTFSADVTEPIMLNGEMVIPAGASVSGRVAQVANTRRIAGRPSVDLRPDKITLPDGRSLPISAVVVDTGNPRRFGVDDEGRIKTPSANTHDTRETLIATGAGVGVGAVVGGVPGAVVGGAVGAGAATTHRFLRRRYAELPAGTILIVELRRPLDLVEQAFNTPRSEGEYKAEYKGEYKGEYK
jgi:hypothetical protein